MTAKENNRVLYPDANHQPKHKASFRKLEAIERQESYDKLSIQEKIALLPPEPHAKKQRERLLNLLKNSESGLDAAEKAVSQSKKNKKGKSE